MEQALLAISQNDTLSEAFVKASQGAELSAVERVKLRFWWAAFVRSAHSHVVQTGLGNLSEDNRLPVRQIFRQFSQGPILGDALRQMIDQELYPKDFCDWVSEHVLS